MSQPVFISVQCSAEKRKDDASVVNEQWCEVTNEQDLTSRMCVVTDGGVATAPQIDNRYSRRQTLRERNYFKNHATQVKYLSSTITNRHGVTDGITRSMNTDMAYILLFS
jgi:hypothetical protein